MRQTPVLLVRRRFRTHCMLHLRRQKKTDEAGAGGKTPMSVALFVAALCVGFIIGVLVTYTFFEGVDGRR